MHPYYVQAVCLTAVTKSGSPRLALYALLLLTLPDVFMYHVLFALLRFALRRRTF